MLYDEFVMRVQYGGYATIGGARRALRSVQPRTKTALAEGEGLIAMYMKDLSKVEAKKKGKLGKKLVKALPESLGPVSGVVLDVVAEYRRAKGLYPNEFSSAHEGYAVILEELDELKAEVWKRGSQRDKARMREECVQIAAMAIQFAVELT